MPAMLFFFKRKWDCTEPGTAATLRYVNCLSHPGYQVG
jgi:hypothetical protein